MKYLDIQDRYDNERAIFFFFLLISILIFFIIVNCFIHYLDIRLITPSNTLKLFLPYTYGIIYSIISGFMLFFGTRYMNKFFISRLPNDNFATLVTVSILIFASFLYAEMFKIILENIFKYPFHIEKWANAIGYFFSRCLVILIIYLILLSQGKLRPERL